MAYWISKNFCIDPNDPDYDHDYDEDEDYDRFIEACEARYEI